MEIKSDYLERFKNASKHIKLSGNKLLVERVELGEARTKGGLIIAERADVRSDIKSMKPLLAVVIAVGEGYFDADSNSYIPLDTKAGDIVILNPNGASFFSVVPALDSYSDMKIGITTEADVQMSFASMEDFEAYKAALNG